MKNIHRKLAFILVLLMVLPFGISSVFAQEDIQGIDIGYYSVVYSSGASADIKQTVKDFGKYLNKYCDAEVEVIQDVGNKPTKKEIIIGNTNRPAGTDVVLKEKDWYVYTDGTKIYLNAYSEGALPLVIEWFKHNCLINGSRTVYVDGYFYSHDYSFKGCTIGGNSADDLVIAYEDNDHIGFVDAAYTLTYAFMERNGLPLSVASAATREQPQLIIASALNGSKYLPAGVSVGSSEYVLCRNGKDIVLVADSSYGAELAVQRIIDKIYDEDIVDLASLCSNTPVRYTLGKDSLPITNGAEYRIMTFNPGRYTLIQEDRCDETLALMAYYAPDVIGFQEYCDYFSRHMTSKLDDIGYAMIGNELCEDLPENAGDWLLQYNMTPIAYRTDRFDCIASGWQRMTNTYNPSEGKNYRGHQITWAILKETATGEIFGVTSTHFFHLTDRDKANPIRTQNATELLTLVENLKAKYNCPFISVGDYNSYTTDEAYKKIEGSELFADSRNVASTERMITAAGHAYNKVNTSNNDCIDFLFVTNEVSVVRNKIAINELTASAGDHYPVFSDIVINTDAKPGPAPDDIQTSMEFPSISASAFNSDKAQGKTTVGRNDYTPIVEVKTSAPLEEDEFWEMKYPSNDTIPDDSDTGANDKKSGGCGSSISGGIVVMIATISMLACIVNIKKERK